jgi:ribosomal protein S18 acetylase RimI-like enzyme
MNIELAESSELDIIFDIYQQCRRVMESDGIFQWYDGYPTREIVADDIRNKTLFTSKKDSELCGVINISSDDEPECDHIEWKDKSAKTVAIHRLAVHPNFQKGGIARKLMDFAEEYAFKNGCTYVRLNAYSVNDRALRFYDMRQYERRGEVFFPGRTLPFFCFEKKLN